MTQILELVLADNLFSQLKKTATTEGSDVKVIAQEAIQRYIQAAAQQKMQEEITAYHDMHAHLLANYKGHYVAVHQGELIDQDVDQYGLYLRIQERYPDEVVLIRQVRTEAEPTWMIRTPRFEHEAE